MNHPFVSESEAFLLGSIVGEHETRRMRIWLSHSTEPIVHVENPRQLLKSRLRPFVPQFRSYRWMSIESLPEDAETVGDDIYRCEQYPEVVSLEGQFYVPVEDNSRQSLTDLLTALLPEGSASEFAHVLQKSCVDSHCEHHFAEGRQFGQFLGRLLTLQFIAQMAVGNPTAGVSEADEPLVREFHDERPARVAALLSLSIVSQNQFVRQAIETDSDQWPSKLDFYVMPSGEIDGSTLLQQLEGSLHTYWLCVGMIFRALNDLSVQIDGRPLPRQFLTPAITSLAALRASMDIAARELHSPRPELPPDGIVANLVTGIEPLVRDLWPNEVNIGSSLRRRPERASADERKFAAVALTLFDTYRNKAVHEGHAFHLEVNTWNEAMYVYSAMKLLVDLHAKLKPSSK